MKLFQILDWVAPKVSKKSLNPVAPLEHINCFKYESIINMANRVGLEQLKIPLKLKFNFIAKKPIKNILKIYYRYLFPKNTYIFYEKNSLIKRVKYVKAHYFNRS